ARQKIIPSLPDRLEIVHAPYETLIRPRPRHLSELLDTVEIAPERWGICPILVIITFDWNEREHRALGEQREVYRPVRHEEIAGCGLVERQPDMGVERRLGIGWEWQRLARHVEVTDEEDITPLIAEILSELDPLWDLGIAVLPALFLSKRYDDRRGAIEAL